jgi:hypothetical protein
MTRTENGRRRTIDSADVLNSSSGEVAEGGDLGNSGSGLDERLYALSDANFNVTAIVDTSGVVQERYIYDPYGARAILDADWSVDADNASDFGWVHGHQGLAEDPETGLVQITSCSPYMKV